MLHIVNFAIATFDQVLVQGLVHFCYRITKSSNFLGGTSLCQKHVVVFFEDSECNKIFFPINWKKSVLILKVIISS